MKNKQGFVLSGWQVWKEGGKERRKEARKGNKEREKERGGEGEKKGRIDSSLSRHDILPKNCRTRDDLQWDSKETLILRFCVIFITCYLGNRFKRLVLRKYL